jgi:hypothetical protein
MESFIFEGKKYEVNKPSVETNRHCFGCVFDDYSPAKCNEVHIARGKHCRGDGYREARE